MSSQKTETRARILDAAETLLEQRGYHGVGLEEVARKARVSRQSVYLHFGSKAKLLIALAQYHDQQAGLGPELQRVFAAASGREALDLIAGVIARHDAKLFDVMAMIADARRSDPAADAAWQERMESRRNGMRRIAQWLRRDGVLWSGLDVDGAADVLWAVGSPFVFDLLVRERGWSMKRYEGYLRRTFRALVLAD